MSAEEVRTLVAESAPFVTQMRARAGVYDLAGADADGFVIRAQVHEAWDAIRLRVAPGTVAAAVKRLAVGVLLADTEPAEDYMMKVGGTEVRDETQSLQALGVRAGTMVFVHARRRRPVR